MAPRPSTTDEQYITEQLIACGLTITFNVHEVAKNTGTSATAVKSKLSAIKKRTGLNIKTTTSTPPKLEALTGRKVGGAGNRAVKKTGGMSSSVNAEATRISVRATSRKRRAKKYMNYAEEDSDVDEDWEEAAVDEYDEEKEEATEVTRTQVRKYRKIPRTLTGPRESADTVGTNRLLTAVDPLKRQREAGMVNATENETESNAELVEMDGVNNAAKAEWLSDGEQGKVKIAGSEESEEEELPENESSLMVTPEHKRLFDSIVEATKQERKETFDVHLNNADNDDGQLTSSTLTEVQDIFETPAYFQERIIHAHADGTDIATGTKRVRCISPDSPDPVKKPRLSNHEDMVSDLAMERNVLDEVETCGGGVADANTEKEVAKDDAVEPKMLQSPQTSAGSV